MDFSLSAAQEAFLEHGARRSCATGSRPRRPRIDETGAFPRELVGEAARLSLTGVTIPTEFGGGGHDTVTYAMAMEAVSFGSATLAVILSVNNSLVAEPIRDHGTAAQKDRWLRAARDRPRDRRVRAVGGQGRVRRGQSADDRPGPTRGGYVLRGTKVWVANAEAADVVIVFARTRARLDARAAASARFSCR